MISKFLSQVILLFLISTTPIKYLSYFSRILMTSKSPSTKSRTICVPARDSIASLSFLSSQASSNLCSCAFLSIDFSICSKIAFVSQAKKSFIFSILS